jgi:hypothetical protein
MHSCNHHFSHHQSILTSSTSNIVSVGIHSRTNLSPHLLSVTLQYISSSPSRSEMFLTPQIPSNISDSRGYSSRSIYSPSDNRVTAVLETCRMIEASALWATNRTQLYAPKCIRLYAPRCTWLYASKRTRLHFPRYTRLHAPGCTSSSTHVNFMNISPIETLKLNDHPRAWCGVLLDSYTD